MTDDLSLADLAARTAETYQEHAKAFAEQRSKSLFERGWLERFAALLSPGAKILDLGSGPGDPFYPWFTNQGYQHTGIDIAPAMLDLASRAFPKGDWRQADMRDLALPDLFDGIFSWHAFFHLTQAEQLRTLSRIAGHLKPGGALMLTVGPSAGEVIGHVNGAPVYHASLSPDEYETALNALGLRILDFVKEDPECDRNTVLLAQKD